MARPRADSLKLWNFLSITVFRGFQGLEKLFFWALQCFVRFRPRNTAMLKFCELWGCEMLVFFEHYSVFVRFRPRNTVMLKKFQNFKTWNSRNTVMLKKFQKFQNSGIYGQAGGRFLKILEFFEHYSVSWVSGLEILEFFEHYSVL